MPDITEDVPTPIGSAASSSSADPGPWDIMIGDLGFLLLPTTDNPYERATEQPTKQQIDTAGTPGEQTLSSWWARSQNTWDRGAGINWYEPGTVPDTEGRFGQSAGIDPWTPGQLTLLNKPAAPVALTTAGHVCGLEVASVAGYVLAAGATIGWYPSTGAADERTVAGAGWTQPAGQGGGVWVGGSGAVYRYTPGAAPVSTWTCTGTPRCWWVKSRVVVALNNALYAVGAGAAAGALATAGVTLMTHPDTSWVWTDVTETGGAILAAGYSGADSAIYRFTVHDDSSGVPVLDTAGQVGRFPTGEQVTAMQVYLGSVIVLGTSLGVRVGEVSDAGDVRYGPLTVSTDKPVKDVTFRDRFAYLPVAGTLSGAVRVDLSAPIGDTGLYAWATDMPTETLLDASSIALVGSQVILCGGTSLYVQGTVPVDSGYLDTGNIRFGTAERKVFRSVRVDCATNGGTVQVTALTLDGTEHTIVTFGDSYVTDQDITITVTGRPTNQALGFRVRLTPSSSGVSPVVRALTVKAVPAVHRVLRVKYPLSCFESEKDRAGLIHHRDPYARIAALEELETTGAPVRVADVRTGETFTAQIDSAPFAGTLAPSGSNENVGGVLTVTVRRL